MGFFEKLKQGLSKTASSISSVFTASELDDDFYDDLEESLIVSDLGMDTTETVMDRLRQTVREQHIKTVDEAKIALRAILADMLNVGDSGLRLDTKPSVILVIGVNGVGKTTTIGKLAHQLRDQGKKVLLCAGDTFRAAAADQLEIWSERAHCDIIRQHEGADPASVVYDAIAAAKARGSDVIICDTAGRLHNKQNLMNELNKISRILDRELPNASKEVLLVLDGTTGQNGLLQAKQFQECAGVTGMVLTKLDGTAKGGVVIAVAQALRIPVKFIGVGNESWGCGGSMRPEYYADLYRRYSTYCRNYDGNRLFKIASGASDYDYNWTETLMKNVGGRMDGISLHYYTVTGWNGSKGSATNFNKDDYYWTMGKCLEIEDVVRKHIQIMDKYDPQKKIGLMVDEWGTWWDEEPGTINGHLYQQNTMRDAFVAALTLNVFHKYTDRVRMTNIAQIVNVLQSMILTNGPKMLLTPTYYVFQMYNVHQDATFLPMDLICDKAKVRGGREVPMVSASASKDKNGRIHISLANVDVDNAQSITLDLQGQKIGSVKGRILTSASINDHNTFEKPDAVKPATFDGAKIEKGQLKIDLPAKSIVVLEVK